MPYRTHGRGSFVLDRIAGKLGRVRVASGTTDPRLFSELNHMLSRLIRERRWDLLGLLSQHQATPLELYDALGRGELDRLPTAESSRRLSAAISRWLPVADVSSSTRQQYAGRLAQVTRRWPNATLADVPEILRELRAVAVAKGHRVAFNSTRSALGAMLRDVLGRSHRLSVAARDVQKLGVTPRAGNPLTPAQVSELAQRLGSHGRTLWSLCLTGMRAREYWDPETDRTVGDWTAYHDRVEVRGSKTAAAVRVVPHPFPVYAPTVGYQSFFRLLNRLTDGAVRPHDCRRTFAYWCEEAGISDTRARVYLGHAVANVTERYRRHDVRRHLAEDADKLRAFLAMARPALRGAA